MTELVIEVKADTKDAQKTFKDFGNNIDDLAKKSKTFSETGSIAFGSFIGSLASQATIAAFNTFREGLSSAIGFIKDSVTASSDAEYALNQLNISLSLAGQFSKDTSDDFVKFAEKLQDVTAFEDDLIIKNASMLESFAKLDRNGLKVATKAALDLSAATGKGLEESFGLLAKASIGATERLSQSGIVIKKTGDNAKDFNLVLAEINKQFGGAAEAQVQTFSGAVEQLSNSFGNFQESIGDVVTKNPVVISGIATLKEVFSDLTTEIIDNDKILKQFVSDSLAGFLSLIPQTIAGVGKIINAFSTLSIWLNKIVDFFLEVRLAFLEFENASASFNSNVVKLFGKSTEVYDEFIAKNNKLIDINKLALEANKKDTQAKLDNQKKINEAFDSFVAKTEKSIESNLEKQKTVNKKSTEDYLKNLNEKNKGNEAANKNSQKIYDDEQKRIEENRKIARQYIDDLKKLREEQNKQIEGALGGGLFNQPEITQENRLNPAQQAELQRNRALGGGIGIAQSVLGGERGAKDLLVGGATAIANTVIPGLGKAIGPILDALAQGPDAVKKFISDFVKSVPILITNLVEAIPAVGEALLEQVPILFDSLIASLPRVINSFIEKIPTIANAFAAQSPFIAAEFAISFVKNIPYIVSSIASGAYNAIVNIFNQLNPFSSDSAAGGFVSDVGDFLGFAQGGYVKKVPNGFPNDSFPARLSEGEIVIDRSNAAKLESFLNNQGDNSGILLRILDAVSSPMTVESNVQVNQQTFANIILELSRQNRRLA